MKTSNTAREAIIYAPTALQVESWRLLWEELVHDAWAAAAFREWEDRRRHAQPQMLELLGRFSSGSADLEQFRATFDSRTRTSWDLFGLRGASGGMFLNKLIKYVPDVLNLADRLRTVLVVPDSIEDGRARLSDFVVFLRGVARSGNTDARRIQPARAIFFVTTWWHLQDNDVWPGFQLSARAALQSEEGLFAPTGNPIDDYFTFRETYLALASAIGLTTWQLEYLCWWHQHRERKEEFGEGYNARKLRIPTAVRERRVTTSLTRSAPQAPTVRKQRTALDHTHIQWLLARIGRQLGCRIWTAANDRTKEWNGESLASLSIDRLPSLGLDLDSQRIISLIDVVWLRGSNQVAAAFEVERTTAVYSGLLRLADLAASAPNLNFPLYIVAPQARLEKVGRELSRPTFKMLELDRRCAFFSGEVLIDAAADIMRWGNSPGVIERLAQRVTREQV